MWQRQSIYYCELTSVEVISSVDRLSAKNMGLPSIIARMKKIKVRSIVTLHALCTDPFGSGLHDRNRNAKGPPPLGDVLTFSSSKTAMICFVLFQKGSFW